MSARSVLTLLPLATLCLMLAACSNTTALSAAPTAGELSRVMTGEFSNRNLHDIALTADDLLASSDEMRRFLNEQVPAALPPSQKLRQLLHALTNSLSPALLYRPGDTYNAADTFARRGGNCVSLAALVVALAREAGLNAGFNEVDVPPTWDMVGENRFVFYKHISAVVDPGGGDRQIVDLTGENYNTRYRQQRINDRQARAQYHNNLAMEWLERAQPAVAIAHLKIAIELAPEKAYLWGNLGTVYRRTGDYTRAEIAYRQAHNLDPQDATVISNLARLYRLMGAPTEARRFHEAAATLRSQSPYYRFSRAREALAAGDYEIALAHIEAALRADDGEPRFHHLAALIHRSLDNDSAALRHLQRATELSESRGREKAKLAASR